MLVRLKVPDLSNFTVDMDALEAELKKTLREIGDKYYEKMKGEIEVGTGASQNAFSEFFYDDGTSFKLLLIEPDPSGSSHHQHWYGAHFQEYGAPNRVQKSWLKENEEALKAEIRSLVRSAIKEATGA